MLQVGPGASKYDLSGETAVVLASQLICYIYRCCFGNIGFDMFSFACFFTERTIIRGDSIDHKIRKIT